MFPNITCNEVGLSGAVILGELVLDVTLLPAGLFPPPVTFFLKLSIALLKSNKLLEGVIAWIIFIGDNTLEIEERGVIGLLLLLVGLGLGLFGN